MTAPTPERALRLALIGWGLGELAMGRTRIGVAWLFLEAAMLVAVAATTLLWADTTWYLLPYLLGIAFLVLWAAQAVLAYRRARSLQAATPAARPRSPAAIVAWLALPLLAWGTGFWLIGAGAASPGAAADAFLTDWAILEPMPPPPLDRGDEGPMVEREAAEALHHLQDLCDAGRMSEDCHADTKNLLRDIRVSIEPDGALKAIARAQLVEYRRRATRVLGVLGGTELQPFPIETVLTLRLEAQPAALGARRWVIVNAAAG